MDETRDTPPDTLSDEEIGTAGPGGDRLGGGGDDDSTDGESGDDSDSSDADADDA